MNRVLWIGDLEPWMEEFFITRTFNGLGRITNVKLCRNRAPSGALLGSGYAFVEFATHDEAANVMECVKGLFFITTEGHKLRMNWSTFGFEFKKASDLSSQQNVSSLYIGGLDFHVTEEQLFKLFASKYDTVASSKIVMDTRTGLSKGYGFVRFRCAKEAEKAITQMQGVYLGCKPIKVKASLNSALKLDKGSVPPSASIRQDISVVTMGFGVYIGGLSYCTSEDELATLCGQFGRITRVHMFRDECIGYGEFYQLFHAQQAASVLRAYYGYPTFLLDEVPSGDSLTPAAALQDLLQAAPQLAAQMEPGLEHFKTLLLDLRFVQIFEQILSQGGPIQDFDCTSERMKLEMLDTDKLFYRSPEDSEDPMEAVNQSYAESILGSLRSCRPRIAVSADGGCGFEVNFA